MKRLATTAVVLLALLILAAGGYRFALSRLPAVGGVAGAPAGGPPPAQVTVLAVAARDVPLAYEFAGQVSGSREVEVRARVTGIIEKRLYEEGARVEEGAPLFRLDPAPYAAAHGIAAAGLAQAQAREKQAQREFDRIAPLAKTQAVSKKETDDAQSALDLARAAVTAAAAELDRARIDLEYTDVKAPIAGVTGRAQKMEGSLVGPGVDSLLTTMAQTDPAHVHFSMPEEAFMQLKEEIASGAVTVDEGGMSVLLKTPGGAAPSHPGRVDFTDYKADPATGSFAMRAAVPNPGGALAPGQFVRVILSGLTRPGAIAVPQRAVLENPQGKYVYVAGHDDGGKAVALPRPVTVGAWALPDEAGENAWVIRDGLREGDRVIVEGTARIFFPGAPIVVEAASPPAGAP